MLKKLLVALIASAFTLGAYAQAPKSETAPATKSEAKGEKEGGEEVHQVEDRRREGQPQGRPQGTEEGQVTQARWTKMGSEQHCRTVMLPGPHFF